MRRDNVVGADAVATDGWLRAHRYLIARRLSQVGFLVLFLVQTLLDQLGIVAMLGPIEGCDFFCRFPLEFLQATPSQEKLAGEAFPE